MLTLHRVAEVPGLYGKHIGKQDYDWGYHTTPQKNVNGRSLRWPSGKVLGGSSAINFLVSPISKVKLPYEIFSHLYRSGQSRPSMTSIHGKHLVTPDGIGTDFQRLLKELKRLYSFHISYGDHDFIFYQYFTSG